MPIRRARYTCHEDRRQGPAEVAGQAVYRERMTEPRRRDAMVQEREVGWMKDAVAESGDGCSREQHRVTVRCSEHDSGCGERGDAEEQYRPSADAVDDESGECLPHPTDGEEYGHQQARFRKAECELAHQPGKQRRQHQVIKMRRAVCEPDEADNFGIVPKGGGSGGSAHRDCGRKAIYCIRHVRYLAARSAASRPARYLS